VKEKYFDVQEKKLNLISEITLETRKKKNAQKMTVIIYGIVNINYAH